MLLVSSKRGWFCLWLWWEWEGEGQCERATWETGCKSARERSQEWKLFKDGFSKNCHWTLHSKTVFRKLSWKLAMIYKNVIALYIKTVFGDHRRRCIVKNYFYSSAPSLYGTHASMKYSSWPFHNCSSLSRNLKKKPN